MPYYCKRTKDGIILAIFSLSSGKMIAFSAVYALCPKRCDHNGCHFKIITEI